MLTAATKTRAAGAILAVALSFVLQVPQPAAAATTSLTTTEIVHVRSGPSATSPIVGSLDRGAVVAAQGSSNGWTKITFAGRTAYVASPYLSQTAAQPTATTVTAGLVRKTTTAVNLRKGPGTSYQVSTVLAKGVKVTTAGKSSKGYALVIKGSLTGWVSSRYLAKTSGVLPAVIGTKVATTALDIRTSSGPDSKTLSEVKKGTVLSVTGANQNGRAQIVYRKAARWVTAKYLANPVSNLPKPPVLPRVTGTRYATAALNIRSTYQDKRGECRTGRGSGVVPEQTGLITYPASLGRETGENYNHSLCESENRLHCERYVTLLFSRIAYF